jgi:hypothetical protein
LLKINDILYVFDSFGGFHHFKKRIRGLKKQQKKKRQLTRKPNQKVIIKRRK